MLEGNLALALQVLADLIDTDFLVPGRHGEEIRGGGPGQVAYSVVWWRDKGDVLGESVGGGRCC